MLKRDAASYVGGFRPQTGDIMALKIKTPVEKVIKLTIADPTGETYVTFRQATQGVVDMLEDLRSAGTEYSYHDEEKGRMVVTPKQSAATIRRMQIFWTLCDCNIVDSDDTPLFQIINDGQHAHLVGNPDMFKAAWDKLDAEVGDEVYQAMLTVNPQWAPNLGE